MPDRVNRGGGPPVDGDSQPGRGWFGAIRRGAALFQLPWRARCLGCGEAGVDGRDLCPACHAALPRVGPACPTCGLPHPAAPQSCAACRRLPPPLARVAVPYLYAAPLDRWLPRFKFHHDLAAGRLLSQLMLEACAHAPLPDALVPVPLHRARLRSRGYDQALELAKPLARTLALPLRTDLLRRVRATAAQSSLNAADRHRNLEGAFTVAEAARAHPLPAHVALVDDVMTTGATLHAAAHALLAAGVTRIDAWACARVP